MNDTMSIQVIFIIRIYWFTLDSTNQITLQCCCCFVVFQIKSSLKINYQTKSKLIKLKLN